MSSESKFCTYCGASNLIDDNFCRDCGRKIKGSRERAQAHEEMKLLAVIALLADLFISWILAMSALDLKLGLALRALGPILGSGIAVASIAVAYGFWSDRRWSRILGLRFSGMEMLIMATYTIIFPIFSFAFYAIFYILKDIVTIYYLTRPHVKTYFTTHTSH